MKNNIKKIIKEKGLNTSFVIKKVGIARSSFYDIINGNSIPSLANAIKISDVLEEPLDTIFPHWIVQA